MPKVAKDKIKKEKIENTKIIKEAPPKSTRAKKSASIKVDEKNNKKSTSKTKASSSTKKSSSLKESKTSTRKKTTSSTNKKSSKKSTKAVKLTQDSKTSAKVDVIEYYDLPFRYNETTVKVLVQTPTCLFIYWDISDADRANLIKVFGDNFFESTKPVLIITNETMNYTFEIDINDFANSWYLHVQDSSCKYKIELGRRPINSEINVPNSYVHISSSNIIETPNDHILFDELKQTAFFRDVKTNVVVEKNIFTLSHLRNIGKIYNIYDLYKKMYKDEFNCDDFGVNLSSSQSSSNFI